MAPATAAAHLPDEILEDIFLRLDAAVDLARASAACTSFRRVVSAHPFLRRYRSLHPPPLLGFFHGDIVNCADSFLHAEPPHRCAPAARALVEAGTFTFSFLPDPESWRVRDARDGCVLLSRLATTTTFADLVVCDPLHRRYVLVPSVPGDLAASIRYRDGTEFEPFLVPAGEAKAKDDQEAASFGVIYNVFSEYKVVAFVFTSVAGNWCEVASFNFLPYKRIREPCRHKRYYAHRCICWMHPFWDNLLVLDTREMKFSALALPSYEHRQQGIIAVLDAGEDRLGLLLLGTCSIFGRNLELHCRTLRNNVLGAEEWHRKSTIPLPEDGGDWFEVTTANTSCHLSYSSVCKLYTIIASAKHMKGTSKGQNIIFLSTSL